MLSKELLEIEAHRLLLTTDKLEDKLTDLLPGHIDTKEALTETLCFLEIIGLGKVRLSPSKIIDLVWHELILCTKVYSDYCKNHFGRYIHHTPGGKASTNAFNFEKALALYTHQFGTLHPEIWGNHSIVSCGNCETL